jgi:hypothetical protein
MFTPLKTWTKFSFIHIQITGTNNNNFLYLAGAFFIWLNNMLSLHNPTIKFLYYSSTPVLLLLSVIRQQVMR